MLTNRFAIKCNSAKTYNCLNYLLKRRVFNTSSANIFSKETNEKLKNMIGGMQTLNGKKVILAMLLTTNGTQNLEETYLMNKTQYCPFIEDDWFLYLFIRSWASVELTSVNLNE